MGGDSTPSQYEVLRDAQQLMESALDLLDRAGAPAHIGAHLDLAICALRSAVEDAPCGRRAEVEPRLRS